MMEVQNQKGECSNEIEFYFRPAQHLLMDISCGGSGVCGLSGDQGAQKIHKVGLVCSCNLFFCILHFHHSFLSVL